MSRPDSPYPTSLIGTHVIHSEDLDTQAAYTILRIFYFSWNA